MKRSILKYFGGKYRLAPWIISHFPEHRCYVEPYGGAASVLLQKRRSHSEIYNDIDSRIVTLFKVLRDPVKSKELYRLLKLTPYARRELACQLSLLKGTVILSGYHSVLYDELYASWFYVEKTAFDDASKPRIEVLWSNRPLGKQIDIFDATG